MALQSSARVSKVPEVDPDLLAEFNVLTEQAAHYRRYSYGAPPEQQRTDADGRTYAALLSDRLLSIHHMVKLHPELEDEYREWRRLYPTFTSD